MVDLMKESLSQVDSMINTMKCFNELSVSIMENLISGSLKTWPNQPSQCGSSSIICPPQDNCPPRCLLTITRHANPGETIIVPFRVRNRSHTTKIYKLGIRPLTDQHGSEVSHPAIDRTQISIDPGLSAMAEMRIEINNSFTAGSLYETDIVIRENRHNQNICFKLYVDSVSDIPEAEPIDETDIDTHFHRWYHHYYCEDERYFAKRTAEK